MQLLAPPPKALARQAQVKPRAVKRCKPTFTLRIDVNQQGGMPRAVPANVAADTYVIPQNHHNPVVCTAVTGPNNDPAEHAQVAWVIAPPQGGGGIPNGQTVDVSSANTGVFTVTATFQGLQADVTIWVVWCNLAIAIGGNIPARCLVDFSQPAATMVVTNPRVLGSHDGLVGLIRHGVGRVCLTGTFVPANAHTVITAGVTMRRFIIDEKTSTDGNAFVRRQNIADHTGRPDKRQWALNAHEEVFDLDAPNVAYWHGALATTETYMHFQQHVEYFGVVCSGTLDWNFIGEIAFGNLNAMPQAHPNPPEVLRLLQPHPCPAVVIRNAVAGAALNVAGIAAPRYAVAANPAGGYDVTNNGQLP
jgi:hypothetical protein